MKGETDLEDISDEEVQQQSRKKHKITIPVMLWIKYENYDEVEVPTKDCKHITNLKDVIIKTLELGISAGDLNILIENKITESLRPDMTLEKLVEEHEINQNSLLIARVIPGIICLKGPYLSMDKDALLEFLEKQMKDPKKFNCAPRTLTENDLKFKLCGRERAIARAAKVYSNFNNRSWTILNRCRAIPVCSGLSGTGKTRMLEEWERIFDKAGIGPHRLGIIVPYDKEFDVTPVENLLKIEASLAWRLLYRCFLHGNSSDFKTWMDTRLPYNANDLHLDLALRAIRTKWGQLNRSVQNQVLHIFVGIDGYDNVKKIIHPKSPNFNRQLEDLMAAIGHALENAEGDYKTYPMMTGRYRHISSKILSHLVYIFILPMHLLSYADVEDVIGSVEKGDELLQYAHARKNFLCLGGVPGWIVHFVSRLLETLNRKGVLTEKVINEAFTEIEAHLNTIWDESMDTKNLIKLAAYSISGVIVALKDTPIAGISWSVLRDQSLCILDEYDRVIVPFTIFRRVAKIDLKAIESKKSKYFVKCIKEFIEHVDDIIFDVEPWNLWKTFGAYFHALRINSLLVIGRKTASVHSLFNEACINLSFNEDLVLNPTSVVHCMEGTSAISSAEVKVKDSATEKHNWIEENIIVISGNAANGPDVFFSMETTNGRTVVFLDQRIKFLGFEIGLQAIESVVREARLDLEFLPAESFVIPCLFNCTIKAFFWSENLPVNSIAFRSEGLECYYGSLYTHPSAVPYVDINHAPCSYINMLLDGTKDKVEEVAKAITSKRDFTDLNELEIFIKRTSEKVTLKHDLRNFIVFQK
ncbi:hypothetical protein MP638_005196 [Amoeboaphelidium occidentale]|nr:hypothetical protein MP638_005196 [Amoeboaphelidium occidentale]